MRRLQDTCHYLRGSQSTSRLESHLKHLSETAAYRLHDSYSLLLTINWAVPILGFLGTVIGITLAIANVTPEQLDTSLNSVTGGLAVAFDTTTVAMSFSLILVFAYDWIKRSEQRVLSTVDDIALQELLPLFARAGDDADPLQEAQAEAAKQLIDRTETLVQEQTEFWRDSVDGLRERWSETIHHQQTHLSEALESQVAATLDDHSSQLSQTRQVFLSAFEQTAQHFATALETDRQSREERDESSRQTFEHIWQRFSDDLQAVIRSHDAHTEDVIDGLVEQIKSWQSDLERSTQSIDSQMERLQTLTETLLRLADQEQHLVRVERQLSENLESVRAAETFEQTLHNLTAAVHLLTARVNSKAA
jgi:biopolymer transport protein ExbB/TolQ